MPLAYEHEENISLLIREAFLSDISAWNEIKWLISFRSLQRKLRIERHPGANSIRHWVGLFGAIALEGNSMKSNVEVGGSNHQIWPTGPSAFLYFPLRCMRKDAHLVNLVRLSRISFDDFPLVNAVNSRQFGKFGKNNINWCCLDSSSVWMEIQMHFKIQR